MAFPETFLDELRARVGLVQVIQRRVKLTKAGREWKGCCPFHNEKTPSFYVNEDKGFYHCFGCGAHGDVIRFVVEQEGLRFPEAVRSLAAEAGLAIPEESPEARERQKAQAGLHDITSAAATWFTEQLGGLSGANARRYIEERGLTPETQKRFLLGYAPDGNKLKSALAKHGEAKLTEVGLIGHAEERDESYDRFRNRLMFPIRDPRGRVVGFGGRILGDGQPKYLNSPDTALFDKGRLLYNLDLAGPLARKSGRLIVVEGYMDTIALAQAGVEEAVAPLGTALTEWQLQLLWRVVPEPVLCFDGDAAGKRAAERATLKALPLLAPGQSLRILTLPEGQDPDDLVKVEGKEGFEARLANASPLYEYLWQTVVAASRADTPETRAAIKAKLREHVGTIADKDVREQYRLLTDDLFFRHFGWGSRSAAAPLPPRSQPQRWPRDIAAATHSVLIGLLNHPPVAADNPESVARLTIGNRKRQRLRDGLLSALGWNPELTREELDETLRADGLAAIIDEARDSYSLHYSFTSARSDEARARSMLATMLKALADYQDVAVEKIVVQNELRELDEGEDSDRDERAAALMERRRELSAAERAINERLARWHEDHGPDPDLRARSTHGHTPEPEPGSPAQADDRDVAGTKAA
ncbi:DNA primase [Sphingoaurantiacus capsulatus]|uniref:DNA primase n=1 Tax=Sphingoaurantiacus capsulatus TaxID=1771310 RepID=A0ABV7XEW3_9SPHN